MARGVVVIQGFLERETFDALRDIVLSSFADNADMASVKEWGGLPASAVDLSGVMDPIAERARREFGESRLSAEASLCRRHVKPLSYIMWHIDADGAGTHKLDPCFNVWIPLADVGTDLPSLQFIPGSHRKMRTLPLLPPNPGHRSDEWVRANFAQSPFTPTLRCGDALIFDHYVLHRTQPLKAQSGPRVSAELRFTAAHQARTRPVMQDC
jgi:hypothetical protein